MTFVVGSASAQQSFYDFTMLDIEGNPISLNDFRGKVMLVVNVASKCGYTPQYEELQTLYERYQDSGLVVLGFPANNFLGQEPGSNAEIQEFCSSNYGVTFPMFSKISVKGKDIHPLYTFLTSEADDNVGWNFQKFLVDRDGNVITSFKPKTKPLDEDIIAAIEALL